MAGGRVRRGVALALLTGGLGLGLALPVSAQVPRCVVVTPQPSTPAVSQRPPSGNVVLVLPRVSCAVVGGGPGSGSTGDGESGGSNGGGGKVPFTGSETVTLLVAAALAAGAGLVLVRQTRRQD